MISATQKAVTTVGTITDLLPVSRVIYPAATWTSPGNLLEATTLLSLVLLQSQKFTPYSQCLALGEGNGTPLQYSCLENPMDGGAWWAAVHGVTKSRIRLSDFTFSSHSCIGERNGNPLQCSCLENPRDGGTLVGCHLWGHTESDTTEVT